MVAKALDRLFDTQQAIEHHYQDRVSAYRKEREQLLAALNGMKWASKMEFQADYWTYRERIDSRCSIQCNAARIEAENLQSIARVMAGQELYGAH